MNDVQLILQKKIPGMLQATLLSYSNYSMDVRYTVPPTNTPINIVTPADFPTALLSRIGPSNLFGEPVLALALGSSVPVCCIPTTEALLLLLLSLSVGTFGVTTSSVGTGASVVVVAI